MTHDEWLVAREDESEAHRFDATPHFDSAGTAAAPVCKSRVEPPVGSWAATAREMAKCFPDFDLDAWKDEMKEAG